MPQLDELLTSDSVRGLYDSFQAGMLVIDKPGRKFPSIQRDTMDAGEPIAMWVHKRLMDTARYNPGEAPRAGFPYHATMAVTDALREANPPWGSRSTGSVVNIYSKIAHDVIRLLVGNGLAYKQASKTGRSMGSAARLWLAPWPDGRGLRWTNANSSTMPPKVDPREEKRIAQMAEKTVVVVKHHDLHIFKAPKPDAKSVMEWATKFVPAAMAVQDDLDVARKRIAELEAQVSELESKAGEHEWEEVANALSVALGRVGGDRGEGTTTAPEKE